MYVQIIVLYVLKVFLNVLIKLPVQYLSDINENTSMRHVLHGSGRKTLKIVVYHNKNRLGYLTFSVCT